MCVPEYIMLTPSKIKVQVGHGDAVEELFYYVLFIIFLLIFALRVYEPFFPFSSII